MSVSRLKIPGIQTLTEQKNQLLYLKQSVQAIYLTSSKQNLLKLIQNQLPNLCHVDSIKLHHHHSQLPNSKFIYSYHFTHNNQNYFIHFHKKSQITRSYKLILKKIGQTLECAFIRFTELTSLNIIKEKWELAFDTITTSICLTDLQGNILKTNKTFRQNTQLSKIDLLQKKYFYTFFGKAETQQQSPSPKEKLRETILVNGEKKIFEISTKSIIQNTKYQIKLVILRNITKEIRIENQIAQSAKAAELGIISSSIAHELNNPIAGIYALLQTLPLKHKDIKIKKDLTEMSVSIQKCIHIIDKLLNIHHSV